MMMKKILYLGLDPTHCKAEGQITHYPVIQIIPIELTNLPLQICMKEFYFYSHLIITSKSAIKILKEYIPLFGYSMKEWIKKKTVAVGKTTASHLQQEGIYPEYVAEEETAEGITKELHKILPNNPFFFWPHSSESRTIITDFLILHNARFSECVLYTTIPFFSDPLPILEEFDELIFTSPTTVQAFLKIFGKLPENKILTPIGPVTKACLNKVVCTK